VSKDEQDLIVSTLRSVGPSMSDTPQDPRIAVLARFTAAPADSLLAALDAVDPARVWRPISEAPRDGTTVLGLCRHHLRPVQPVWFGDGGWWGPNGRSANKTTHFLPLPEPPEGA
jgi:hypothetical protein